ncbi:hypothetical protein FH608_046375 [Nonomuraea phyllanthi]|uniref:Uncharacterized protein n=1 Tax=Nonomuraea phyllanthi TaxID=2219224 RepID=A0A5C4V6A0_9ACTN|nr:hypothetical protein [Nonomuraea phyllanthi]KAB8186920.1 hypothetical protein FH608_046375 [Nonomuraea phyllanthi]
MAETVIDPDACVSCSAPNAAHLRERGDGQHPDGPFCAHCMAARIVGTTGKTIADEFQSAVDTLRRAAESARRNGHLTGDVLLRHLADPVADWLESKEGIHLSQDGPMPDDFQHALRIARVINQGADHE